MQIEEEAQMKSIMRLIQLSDIHFQTKVSTYNTKQLKDKLPSYLKQLNGQFDVMIITGDYRFAPDKEENPAKIVEYIKTIATSVNIEPKNIITVPGNHDLTRNGVRKAIISDIRSSYHPENGTLETSVLEELLKGFSFYNSMHDQLKDASEWTDYPHNVIEIGMCNFLILNTAFTAGTNEDEYNLFLGSLYLDAAVSSIRNNKPIIAIGHHGLDCLKRDEQKTCTNYFDQHQIRLYLCGHTHDTWFTSFGDNIKQANCGCMKQDDKSVYAGFNIIELFDDGSVKIESHKWDTERNDWFQDMARRKEYNGLYESIDVLCDDDNEPSKVEKVENPLSICGYKLLGGLGSDGIKYIWQKHGNYIESLAFNRRLKMESGDPSDALTSAYTISTSIGCPLSIRGNQCKFCETGASKFWGYLKAEDIALQCIFMAKYDSNCPSYPQVRNNMREFAFMGQGEPGYNYPAIRQAIMLTDYIMERIDQNVSRYIISTCGITDFMPALIEDIKNNVYKNKVTVHFSLHTIDKERNELMPINLDNDYRDFIKYCEILYQVCGEKIGVGILMFNKYQIVPNGEKYTLTPKKLEKILSMLDKDVFRIDLCAVNRTSTGNQHQLSNEKANEFLKIVRERGYEGKLFTSFGDSERSGCGMLASSIEDMEDAGNGTIKQFNSSVDLLQEAQKYMEKKLLEK